MPGLPQRRRVVPGPQPGRAVRSHRSAAGRQAGHRRRCLPARIDPAPAGQDRSRLAADHAGLRRPVGGREGPGSGRRPGGAGLEVDRLSPVPGPGPDAGADGGVPSAGRLTNGLVRNDGAIMSTVLEHRPQAAPPPATPEVNYLNVAYGIKSWLLTTDHKRIALLYLVSVTLMFFVGGAMATLIRLHLLTPNQTPDSGLTTADGYNKLFTMHGVIMVWFFLLPVIPTVLGNFLLPMMIGARDLAFPRLNLASWYVFIVAAGFTFWALLAGGADTGWTFYTPFSSRSAHTNVVPVLIGIVISGF